MKYFIGIDWSSRYDDICIIDETENLIKEFRIDIDKNGFKYFENILESLDCKKEDIYIGIETHKNILAEYLIVRGYKIYSLNPLSINKFKQIFSPSKNKNDKFDAKTIALMLSMTKDKFSPVLKSSSEIEELEMHIATEEMLSKQKTRLILQIRTTLSLYFPAFSEYFDRFSSNVPASLLKFISCAEDINNLSYEDYLERIKEVKYMTQKSKKKFYDFMKEKAIDLHSPVTNAYIYRVSVLADDLITKNKQLKEIGKVIEDIFNRHKLHEVFSSLPSAGKILAPKLLASFGDNKKKFTSYQSVQCYAGSAPTYEGSGKYLSLVKMRRACKKTFKNTLHQFAFCSMRTETWAREHYDKLRVKGNSHSAAVRSVANKWAKIIYRMWKDEALYNADIFLDARRNYKKIGKKSVA